MRVVLQGCGKLRGFTSCEVQFSTYSQSVVYVCTCVCMCVDYCAVPTADVAHLQAQCVLSNDKKLAAKRVSELSSELFFSIFVRVCLMID